MLGTVELDVDWAMPVEPSAVTVDAADSGLHLVRVRRSGSHRAEAVDDAVQVVFRIRRFEEVGGGLPGKSTPVRGDVDRSRIGGD